MQEREREGEKKNPPKEKEHLNYNIQNFQKSRNNEAHML